MLADQSVTRPSPKPSSCVEIFFLGLEKGDDQDTQTDTSFRKGRNQILLKTISMEIPRRGSKALVGLKKVAFQRTEINSARFMKNETEKRDVFLLVVVLAVLSELEASMKECAVVRA